MLSARQDQTATLLPTGKVLVAAGFNRVPLSDAELFNPATGTWSRTGALAVTRRFQSASLLRNGKVLVSGGNSAGGAAELYDPSTGKWTTTPSLGVRSGQCSTLLTNGKILIAGGFAGASVLGSAALYESSSTGTGGRPPVISTAFLDSSRRLVVVGADFRGRSGNSGGNGGQDSSSSGPLVRLQGLDNEQS
ncbi:MAG: hypothetical protein CFE26_22510, partial [Verrucomicrobiales bacterium VVV1]